MAIKMPKEGNPLHVETFLDESEVHTRMSQVLHKFEIVDLHTLDWHKSFEENGLDEFEQTAILTSVEHEFHTIFEDRIFENFTNLDQVMRFVAADHNCF